MWRPPVSRRSKREEVLERRVEVARARLVLLERELEGVRAARKAEVLARRVRRAAMRVGVRV